MYVSEDRFTETTTLFWVNIQTKCNLCLYPARVLSVSWLQNQTLKTALTFKISVCKSSKRISFFAYFNIGTTILKGQLVSQDICNSTFKHTAELNSYFIFENLFYPICFYDERVLRRCWLWKLRNLGDISDSINQPLDQFYLQDISGKLGKVQ
jgi:hypothetical protein